MQKDYSIECSVCMEPLTEAVSLNCNHKINFQCAQQIFGEIEDGECTRPGPCPLCK